MSEKILEGAAVLCVDDESDSRLLISTLLTFYGATVTCCESAEEAVECLRAHCYDVVISDLNMFPGMDGFDLAHTLRQMETEKGRTVVTPTILLSGTASNSPKKRFADFQVYLTKPFNHLHLVDIIARLRTADGGAVKAGSLNRWEANR